MALTYVQFAPSLALFTQYASENVSCLNAFKSYGKHLRSVLTLPADRAESLESTLLTPSEHYSQYSTLLQKFVWTTPSSAPEQRALTNALALVDAQVALVDQRLSELQDSIRLLALQNQCAVCFEFEFVVMNCNADNWT